ncbi:Mrp/NBP35 family ATP-binding protein [Spelaeicoccus albus]|uniref:Iron-sulfur cluster carrier protein n=1 Tax=Spelaeicoccus albus TaxID=1280376 RepID=A0A7Z0D3A9_9MICO|nr:Mrp/NBP35 family ATP-binding protein [Spelaeicoccus albus]NYI68087.1 ATP-binding protein involved in chromosome partitioning [Spelaeicoccus albus]
MSAVSNAGPSVEAVESALAEVNDPEIRKPITELDMVRDVAVSPEGVVSLTILLTVAGCPLKGTIKKDVEGAIRTLDGVTGVELTLGVMTPEQRDDLKTRLRGSGAREIPFAQPDSLTRVYAVASGKGGVGKSSITANLAASMAADGLAVGVIDADIYGFSIPTMLGAHRAPTRVDDMILPPIVHGVKVISIGSFVPANQAVVWRGPMLHRALQQFLTDVFWGDLDVLLLDLPPGTGDIAISVAQLLPGSELLLVTTPQHAAADVAERAGSMSVQTEQGVAGVVENMSWMEMPGGERLEVFGSGGGKTLTENLGNTIGSPVQLLGQIPLDTKVREGADAGVPVVLSHPQSPASLALVDVAKSLTSRERGLAGRSLGLSPA